MLTDTLNLARAIATAGGGDEKVAQQVYGAINNMAGGDTGRAQPKGRPEKSERRFTHATSPAIAALIAAYAYPDKTKKHEHLRDKVCIPFLSDKVKYGVRYNHSASAAEKAVQYSPNAARGQ